MLTRRRVPFGTADDNFLNGLNPPFNDANSHLDSRVRPSSAKDCNRISLQDRTVEFLSAIRYAQTRNPRYNSAPKQKPPPDEFQVISSKIGKDISSTFEKLESLNLILSKKHDAESQDVANQLTEIIRQDLNVLNKQIAQLQQFLRHQMFNRQRMAHSNSVIVAMQSKLVRMTTDFKVILELRQQNVRNSLRTNSQQNIPGYQTGSWKDASNDTYNNQSVMQPRSQRPVQSNYPPPPQHHHHHQQQPPQSSLYNRPLQQTFTAQQPYPTQSNPVFHSHDEHGHQRGGGGGGYQQSQALRQRYVQEDRSKDEMVEIEQTIVELGGIFQQLTTMVHEQGEMVQRIDSHVDNAHLNIDLAHTELVKYFRSVASMRGLMLKVFAVLLIFIVFFFFFYL